MSTDVEKLVVQLSADLKSYENAMAKATGITRAQLKLIKSEATNAGAASGAAFTGASAGVERFGASAGKATSNVRALAAQTNSLRGQTGNLAAQFNDIGVQLAGGQSPFLIALQQGSQISQVLGGQGARGAVAALGGAFMSLLNPVSLVTIGLIAAGGAAVQYFSGLMGDAPESAEELKKQSDLIQRVAKDWGDAVPALAAYAAELERAARNAELLEEAKNVQGRLRSGVAQDFVDLKEAVATAVLPFPDLRQAFGDLTNKMGEGTETSDDFAKVSEAMAAVLRSSANPALADAKAQFDAFAAAAAVAASAAADVGNQAAIAAGKVRDFKSAQAMRDSTREVLGKQGDFIKEQERVNSLTAEQLALETETARVRAQAERSGTVIGQEDAARLAAETLAAEQRRNAEARASRPSSGGGGGRSSAASEAQREAEAVTKLIEALQFEQSLIGMSNVEKEKANALRRAGGAATEEQRAQIESIISATYAETEALRSSEDQLQRLRALSADVLGGMFEDLRDGANAADILANALNRVAESMVKAGIDGLISGAFSGGVTPGGLFGGRIIPGILHSGGTAGVDGYGHGRSVSPSVFTGARRYHSGGVAGMRPGEVPAILQKGEIVIPKGAKAAGGGTVVNYAPVIDARGADSAAVARLEATMRAEVEGLKLTFRDGVNRAAGDPRYRGKI